jgi:hypothetical protein
MDDISTMLAKKPSKEREKLTFENNQNQADISQREKSFLPVMFEDIGQGDSVDDSDGDLANDTSMDDLGREPFCK